MSGLILCSMLRRSWALQQDCRTEWSRSMAELSSWILEKNTCRHMATAGAAQSGWSTCCLLAALAIFWKALWTCCRECHALFKTSMLAPCIVLLCHGAQLCGYVVILDMPFHALELTPCIQVRVPAAGVAAAAVADLRY